MNYLLKNILKPLYRCITCASEREFYRLHSKYAHLQSNSEKLSVQFFNYNLEVYDVQSFIWQFKEIFVDEIYKFNSTSKEILIYDCGANVGMSVLYFKKLFPNAKIKAFEPNPVIANCLINNVLNNNLFKVEIIQKAVWVDDMGVDFGLDTSDGSSIFSNNNRAKVGSIRLKELLKKDSVIDFLKIDIEGSERDVLVDCSDALSNVTNIFIEYHSITNNLQRLSEILNILETNNFRYYMSTLGSKKSPFIASNLQSVMDMQVNIFGKKCV